MTSMWDGIGEAKLFDRGQFFKPGFEGIVRIERTLAKQTRKVGVAFIVEVIVETTNLPEVGTGHPVGWKGSWFVKMQDREVAYSNIARWAAACAGYDPASQKELIEKEVMPELPNMMKNATDFPDNNAFIGARVLLQTVQIKTKADTDFTRYDWSPVAS